MDSQAHKQARMRLLRQAAAKLRLIDDILMKRVFRDNIPAVQLVLEIILGRTDFKVAKVEVEHEVPSLRGRGVRFDIHAVDDSGRHFDVEMQVADSGAGVKRARLNSSLLDASLLNPGEDATQLPDTYVIFITEHDVLDGGQPIYHIERTVRERGNCPAETGDAIIYVNCACRGADPLGMLAQDLLERDASKMHYGPLRAAVEMVKHPVIEGEKEMKFLTDDMFEELQRYMSDEEKERLRAEGEAIGETRGEAKGKVIGKAEGQAEGKMATLLTSLRNVMANLKVSLAQAMDIIGLPAEERPMYTQLLSAQA